MADRALGNPLGNPLGLARAAASGLSIKSIQRGNRTLTGGAAHHVPINKVDSSKSVIFIDQTLYSSSGTYGGLAGLYDEYFSFVNGSGGDNIAWTVIEFGEGKVHAGLINFGSSDTAANLPIPPGVDITESFVILNLGDGIKISGTSPKNATDFLFSNALRQVLRSTSGSVPATLHYQIVEMPGVIK